MRKTVVLSGLMCLVALPVLAAEPAPKKVEMKGTLRTGIVAIGGETTGTIIETKEGKYELDFGTDKDLRKKAEELNGKMVVVTGELNMRHKLLTATLFAATMAPGGQADEPTPDKQVAALSRSSTAWPQSRATRRFSTLCWPTTGSSSAPPARSTPNASRRRR